jgi:hypothetical protein
LLWALWLSFALIRWLPWAWQAFSTNGIWRTSPKRGALGNRKADATDSPPSAT